MRRWLVRIGLFAATVTLVAGSTVLAATAPSPTPSTQPGQGLEISPPVIELTANPGQTITTQIRVRDVTAGELIAKGEVDDFGAGTDESGEPKILLNDNGQSRYSLREWVDPVPSIVLAPQQLASNTITTNVPANAEPGGHYGVVRFTGVPPSLAGTGVALSASVGTLILLRVNGDITENLNLVQFSAFQNSIAKSFFETGPVSFLVRLRNTGSVHEAPKGSITIKDWFGRIAATLDVNANGGNVLPDSIRRYTAAYSEKKLFGHYTAALALTYAGSKTVTQTIGFWVIPWKLLLLFLAGLAVIIYLLKVGLKRYNEHIIAQARRHR
jgi:hypothetical protein